MNDDRASGDWTKLSGVGVELAAAVAGFALLGYWWDRHFKTAPWGLVIAACLGIVGGLYNVVRKSIAASKEAAAGAAAADRRADDR
jgi:F0F1-type ATP synthase assembly protein I